MKETLDLQNDMYTELIQKKTRITVFVKNGVRISGELLASDKFTILMLVGEKQQLIYKHAISTITQ